MGNHKIGFVLVIVFLSAIIISSAVSVFPVNAITYGPLSGGNSNFGGVADDAGFSLKLTRDTGMIFAGYTKSFGNGGSDLWLLKTGLSPYTMQNGVTGAFQREQWNVTFGGAQDDGHTLLFKQPMAGSQRQGLLIHMVQAEVTLG
jgi:hypothetical protein